MRKSTGLRTEILTTIGLLMGAALLLGGVMMLRFTEQSLLDQKIAQLRVITGTLVAALADSIDPGQSGSAIKETVLKTLPEKRLEGWWLYDENLLLTSSFYKESTTASQGSFRQQVRFSGQGLEEVEFPALLQIFSDADTSALFIQPIRKNSAFRGLLEIRYSLDDVRQRLLISQKMILLYVLLYGSVLVIVGYYLLQRNVINPARNLLQATEEVSRGNLATRLPVAGPTEIASLADAYNHMVAALQESRQETQSHIRTLEQTNDELQRTRDELIRSEKLASVGQLAAGLAHELGNPLAALIGYLEVLKGRIEENASAEIVRRSLTEAERIDFLVRELLDFSRPASTDLDNVDPAGELRKCLSLLRNQGVFGDVAVEDLLPSKLPRVSFSANKLQQVFINLLLNAVHACQQGGKVILKAGAADGQVWLDIIDTGAGIPEEIRNRIFDPFFSTKSPGEGTGLGLAICYRLLEEVGGAISLGSDQEEGTCFRIVMNSVED